MTTRWNDHGLLVLRLGVGLIFLVHGLQKALVLGPGGVAGFFDAVGIPLPYANAVFVMSLEVLGGLALLVGGLTRVFAPLLAATMAVAIVTVHLPSGFFMAGNGYEFALMMLLAAGALSLTGAGAYSLDARLVGRTPAATTERPTVKAAA